MFVTNCPKQGFQADVSFSFPLAPVTPPTPQSLAPPKQLSTAAQRQMALNELVTTEGGYHHEIAVFCTKVLPDFKEVRESIFTNFSL